MLYRIDFPHSTVVYVFAQWMQWLLIRGTERGYPCLPAFAEGLLLPQLADFEALHKRRFLQGVITIEERSRLFRAMTRVQLDFVCADQNIGHEVFEEHSSPLTVGRLVQLLAHSWGETWLTVSLQPMAGAWSPNMTPREPEWRPTW